MNTTSRLFLLATTALVLGISGPGVAQIVPVPLAKTQTPDGLLFSLSADKGLTADVAAGQAEPIFAVGAHTVKDGAYGPALSLDDNLALAWSAPLLRSEAPGLAAIAGLGGAFFSGCQALS